MPMEHPTCEFNSDTNYPGLMHTRLLLLQRPATSEVPRLYTFLLGNLKTQVTITYPFQVGLMIC